MLNCRLENELKEKERVIEKLTDEKKVLEKIVRDLEKQNKELKDEYSKGSNVSYWHKILKRLII